MPEERWLPWPANPEDWPKPVVLLAMPCPLWSVEASDAIPLPVFPVFEVPLPTPDVPVCEPATPEVFPVLDARWLPSPARPPVCSCVCVRTASVESLVVLRFTRVTTALLALK